jgi:hypothetical protein
LSEKAFAGKDLETEIRPVWQARPIDSAPDRGKHHANPAREIRERKPEKDRRFNQTRKCRTARWDGG